MTTAELIAALRAADPDGTAVVVVDGDETQRFDEVDGAVHYTPAHANATPVVRIRRGFIWDDPALRRR